ncbi:NERD domain-containing protein [Rummeliibacillus sp. POC4]|nr:NERD domain-containing protein [Rummeliibacillus sp. POC4]
MSFFVCFGALHGIETLSIIQLKVRRRIFLIGKAYSKTDYLDGLDSLIRRLSTSNPKREELINEYNRIQAGDIGEKVVMDLLEKLQLPYDFFIFHNLSLSLETKVQFDVLLLTPHYILILEVKNIKGSVILRDNPSQLVRTLPNGEVQVFNSPGPQLEEYIYQLKTFLGNKGQNIPVYGAVVFPFTSGLIEQSTNKTTILRKNELKSFIRNIPIRGPFLTGREIEYWKDYFLNNHIEFNPYPLVERYNIQLSEIKNGVLCKKCGHIGMKKFPYYWYCPICHYKSKNAHEHTIMEYFKLINNTMTNPECREFLGIQNPNQSYRLIKKMPLQRVGKNRYAQYMLPKNGDK